MIMAEQTMTELTEDESFALLEAQNFGRLALAVAGSPEIVPINYVVADRKIYFRTAEGGKLVGLVINAEVAFETDRVEGRVAESVIVRGDARELTTHDEIEFADSLALRTWTDTPKRHVIEIRPEQITGRRFDLNENAPA